MHKLRAPKPVSMLARLAVMLDLPAVLPSGFDPENTTVRRARWSPTVGAYVLAEKGAHAPVTCLSLQMGDIAIHHNGDSSVTALLTRTDGSARALAEAVWAWERIEDGRRIAAR